jgi:hypothetical protein
MLHKDHPSKYQKEYYSRKRENYIKDIDVGKSIICL